jgi:hypothetical protein
MTYNHRKDAEVAENVFLLPSSQRRKKYVIELMN